MECLYYRRGLPCCASGPMKVNLPPAARFKEHLLSVPVPDSPHPSGPGSFLYAFTHFRSLCVSMATPLPPANSDPFFSAVPVFCVSDRGIFLTFRLGSRLQNSSSHKSLKAVIFKLHILTFKASIIEFQPLMLMLFSLFLPVLLGASKMPVKMSCPLFFRLRALCLCSSFPLPARV